MQKKGRSLQSTKNSYFTYLNKSFVEHLGWEKGDSIIQIMNGIDDSITLQRIKKGEKHEKS